MAIPKLYSLGPEMKEDMIHKTYRKQMTSGGYGGVVTAGCELDSVKKVAVKSSTRYILTTLVQLSQ